MWCADCQQDVPAVAQSTEGPLYCPRCHRELDDRGYAVPTDAGIDLENFQLRQHAALNDLSPPLDELEREQTRQQLRSIGRKLRMTYQLDKQTIAPAWSASEDQSTFSAWSDPQLQAIQAQVRRHTVPRHPSQSSWLVSLLLAGGACAFAMGVVMLAWSAAFQLPLGWQWGMTATFAAEGMFVLGLTWMAVRLWHNSRRINRQLNGVDRQLGDIQRLTGSLVGSRLSASQHYYEHFNQAASPHLLVANLRGQVDQLATRIAAER